MITDVVDFFSSLSSLDQTTVSKLLLSILVLAGLGIMYRVVVLLLHKHVEEHEIHYRWRRVTGYFSWVFYLLVLWRIWLPGFQAFGTYLGLLSAGIAIALKDPIVNFVGWVFILWRQPFSVGERIEIGAIAGDVIDQRLFTFTLMEIGNWVQADQPTGRVMHVPNGRVFLDPVANYTKGISYIWNEIRVLLTFESDWEYAKIILQKIVAQHADHLTPEAQKQLQIASRKYLLSGTVLTPAVYTDVRESGILLTVRYLCEPHQRRKSSEAIWEAVLRDFAKEQEISLAYPTQRIMVDKSVEPIKAD